MSDSKLLQMDVILQNRYKVTDVLGEGGMGAVYLVRDQRLVNKCWALKEMLVDYENMEDQIEAIEQFKLEAETLAKLEHPYLARVSDFFAEGNRHYLVMDYIEGKNLNEMLLSTRNYLPEERILNWAICLCEVLEYLSSLNPPIIFRDLKPRNIMVTPDDKVKLIDFGIAKFRSYEDTKQIIKGTGTVGFSPPEQYGKAKTDVRSDIYALGATLYNLTTQMVPEEAIDRLVNLVELIPPRNINPRISEGLEKVILKAMELVVDKRFQSATEMKDALLNLHNKIKTEICSNCQSKNPKGNLFCAYCGNRLAKEKDSLKIEFPKIEPPKRLFSTAIVIDSGKKNLPKKDQVTIVEPEEEKLEQRELYQEDTENNDLEETFEQETRETITEETSIPKEERPSGSGSGLLGLMPWQLFTCSWPVLRGNSLRTGRIKSKLIPPLKPIWKYETESELISSPVVANRLLLFGSSERLYALEPIKGKLLWYFETKGLIYSTPAVTNNLIYVGSDDASVYAVTAQGGKQVWSFATDGPVRSSPAVEDNIVYFGSQDGGLYALNAETGRLIWKYKTKGSVVSSPAVRQKVVYVGSSDGFLHAVDVWVGFSVWKFNMNSVISSSPAILKDKIFIGAEDGVFYAVNIKDGTLRWQFKTEGAVRSSCSVDNEMVCFGSDDNNFYALSTGTGDLLWRYETEGNISSSPILTDRSVIAASEDGGLYVFSRKDGKVLEKQETDGPIFTSPALYGVNIFVGSNDHYIYDFRGKT